MNLRSALKLILTLAKILSNLAVHLGSQIFGLGDERLAHRIPVFAC